MNTKEMFQLLHIFTFHFPNISENKYYRYVMYVLFLLFPIIRISYRLFFFLSFPFNPLRAPPTTSHTVLCVFVFFPRRRAVNAYECVSVCVVSQNFRWRVFAQLRANLVSSVCFSGSVLACTVEGSPTDCLPATRLGFFHLFFQSLVRSALQLLCDERHCAVLDSCLDGTNSRTVTGAGRIWGDNFTYSV